MPENHSVSNVVIGLQNNFMSDNENQMADIAISIIMPAYNVFDYIDRSVYSLLAQTFTNFELIIVDDGSNDGTAELIDELAKIDARIIPTHQQNSGAASARNFGISKARGKYLYFMDADDWCEPNMLKDMYDFAKNNGLDLVVSGFYIDTYYTDKKFIRETKNAENCIYKEQVIFRNNAIEYFNEQLMYTPWNKLYRTNYIRQHSLLFPHTFWDDLPFNVSVLKDITHIGFLNGHYYHFIRGNHCSENTKWRDNLYEKRCEEDNLLKDLFQYWDLADDENVRSSLALRHAERVIGCIESLTDKQCYLSYSEKKRQIEKILFDQQTIEALQYAQPNTMMMKILFSPMKSKNITLTFLQSQFISFVKNHFKSVFAFLKQHR